MAEENILDLEAGMQYTGLARERKRSMRYRYFHAFGKDNEKKVLTY